MRVKRILAALVTLSLAAAITVVGAWATYSTQVRGSSGTAAVATMAFSAQVKDGNPEDATLSRAGSRLIGEVMVTNVEDNAVCEVNSQYTITLKADQPVPSVVAPTLVFEGKEYRPTSIDSKRQMFTFTSDAFRFSAGTQQERTYDIMLQWEALPAQPTQEINFSVTAVSEQVD